MPDVHLVLLAAGKGTRMKSAFPKVLHRVAGSPMIDYVLAAGRRVAPTTTTVVIGHRADVLRKALAVQSHISCVVQEPQLGTGHALLTTAPLLEARNGTLLLLSGDVPLLRGETLQQLLHRHREAKAAATLVTAQMSDPRGYGRIARSGEQIARVVENKDASSAERAITEVSGD